MQRKCLLLIMMSSCVAQAVVVGDEKKNQFAQLREDLRILRQDANNSIYAEKMVDGVEAIDKAYHETIKVVEAERAARKSKVSSNRCWFGAEAEDTVVYREDKKIDDELNKYIDDHAQLAGIYKQFTLFMHNDLSNNAQQELMGAVATFKTMHKALQECCSGDQCCYDKHGAPLYSKMADQKYRRAIQDRHYAVTLKAAHEENDIPVIDEELRAIFSKNVAYNAAMTELQELDGSIDDLINLEKIKEREVQEKQALAKQLMQK